MTFPSSNDILTLKLELEEFAQRQLHLYDLKHWSFGWDYAKKRLGVCRLQQQHISLSLHFLHSHHHDPIELFDTILHEIAHAIAWTRHGEKTHGAIWKTICLEIGANPRACAPKEMAPLAQPKYALRLKTTGEIIKTYYRKPRFKRALKHYAVTNRPETLGQLELTVYTQPKT